MPPSRPPSSRLESNSIRPVRVSSTQCCARSAPATSSPGSTSWHLTDRSTRWGMPLSCGPTHAGSRSLSADALGASAGELDAALAADDDRPQVHLAARPGVLSADELAAAVNGDVGRFSPYAVYLPSGDPAQISRRARRAGAGAGRRQAIGRPRANPGAAGRRHGRWLDMCAGLGDKTRCWPRSPLDPERGSPR